MLKSSNLLWGLRNQRPKRRIGAAKFCLGVFDKIIARNQCAVEAAGQGFQVQYDSTSAAYENGPTVTSPGTGTWVTSSATITGAQLGEEQNLGADLRLSVTDPSQPLIIQSPMRIPRG